jgi:hypothetical protein
VEIHHDALFFLTLANSSFFTCLANFLANFSMAPFFFASFFSIWIFSADRSFSTNDPGNQT